MMQNNRRKNWVSHVRARLVLPYNVLKCHLFKRCKPLVVLLYVTDRCNLRCRYCQGNWSGRMIKDYSTEEIFNIVDECCDLGTKHFIIHGGEILLRDDIKEIVSYMKQKHLYVNLITNGIILPQKINEIRGVDSLCISLDGSEKANDLNRGEGSFKKIIAAIKLAKNEHFKLNVQTTLTRYNKDEIGYLAKLAKETGYYQQFSFLFKPLKPDQNDIGLNDAEIKDVLRDIVKYKRMGYPIFTSYRVLKNALSWPYPYSKAMISKEEYSHSHDNLIQCFFGRFSIIIDADGFVYPCAALNNNFNALNVKDVGVKRAYEHMLETKVCEVCYFLTHNDWNLLLGLSPRQYLEQVKIQFKEVFNIV